MEKKTVLAHFKTQVAIAQALGISHQAVVKWGDLVPKGSAYQLQVITGGLLRVDESLYTKGASHRWPSNRRVAKRSVRVE